MNRGRARYPHTRGRSPPMRWSPRHYGQSNHPDSHSPDVGGGRSAGTAWRVKEDGRKSSEHTSGDGSSQNTGTQLASSDNSRESYSYERGSGSSNMENCHLKQNSPNALGSCLEQNHKVASVPVTEKDVPVPSAYSGSGESDKKTGTWQVKDGRKSSEDTSGDGSSQNTGTQLASSDNSREPYSYERGSGSSNMENCHLKQNSPNALGSCLESNHKVASVPVTEKDVPVPSGYSRSGESDKKTGTWQVKDGRKSSGHTSGDGSSQNTGTQLASSDNSQESYSYETGSGSSNMENCHLKQNSPNALGSCLEQNHRVASVPITKKDVPAPSAYSGSGDSDKKTGTWGIGNFGKLHADVSNKLNISDQKIDTALSLKPADAEALSTSKNPKNTIGPKTQNSDQPVSVDHFDICPPKESGIVILKPPLLLKNRERRNESKRKMNQINGIVYRPGMVLLKGYILLNDQVKIVKKCRDLGLVSGGFYQPGYRDGGKLHLKMMCLGKNWDPQTREYGDHRPFDDAKPPNIPDEFLQFVEKAMRDSHALIKQESKTENPEKILPGMSPNICLVNFYSQNGHLGLHQDRDESQESLRQGVPVVSFSIGDKADFLYGDERDVDKAQKVELESGDVLIFGGKSRHIFHGVTAIHSNTAPELLLDETNLRPGRLNLTFRQY